MHLDWQLALQILLVTTCICCGWSRGAAIARGSYHPLNVVTVVHAWFSASPIVMEWIWGVPEYRIFVHLRAVNDSQVVWIAYYVFASLAGIAFALCARRFERSIPGSATGAPKLAHFRANRRDRILMWVGLFLPVFCAFFSPDVRIWTNYPVLLELQPNADFATFVNIIYSSTYVALLSACGLLLTAETGIALGMPIGVLTFAAIWLNGKRNIVILAMILIILTLRVKGAISRSTTYVLFAASLVAFFAYSQWYQAQYRPTLSFLDTSYEMARMDFTRDSDIRMALYAELEETAAPILDYRGQTLLFDALFFIPRTMWEDKPKPYYFYITSTALNGPRIYRSWGITTTLLSEAIANMGWLGMLCGPLALVVIASIGYSRSNPFLNVLTCVICTLLMSVHLAGFYVLWSVWCAFVVSSVFARARTRMAQLAGA